MSTKSSAERLAQAVRDRRKQLHMNQLEVQSGGGPSNTLQTEIENGRLESLTPRTARKIDTGLMWEAGSAMRIWEGTGEAVVRGIVVDDDGTLHITDNSEELNALRHYLATAGPDGLDAEPPAAALRLWPVEDLLQAAMLKHRDEMDLLNHIINVQRRVARRDDVLSDPAGTDVHLQAVAKEGGLEQSGESDT